jgi:hypothetical protein
MSEYQFYEFQAIDRPLSQEDQVYVQGLSSRVNLSDTKAQFTYSYGAFRGDPEKLLDRCFDIFVYVASFGVRKLMIRFPKDSVKANLFEPYCVKHNIEVKTTPKSIILDIDICQESYSGWLSETTYTPGLAALREEILTGDLRLLYLAWLASGFAEDPPEKPEDMIEPPVPANLKKLSPALRAFVELFEIDTDLITAAAIESPMLQAQTEPVADWIAALSESERKDYLLRIAQGDIKGGVELMHHLRQKFGKPGTNKLKSPGRTLAELIKIADEQYIQRETKAQQAAATARRKYLEQIAPKADEIWQEVYKLIELKQAKSYEEAVKHLVDLKDLAINQDKLSEFSIRLTDLKRQYKSRSSLMNRLHTAELLP